MHADIVDRLPAAARAGPTVLVVEDDAALRAFLRSALEDEGYRVLTAVTSEALALAHAQRLDLILLAVSLPWPDQVALSRHLRADRATAHIPLIGMVTDYGAPNHRDQLSLDARVRKPFDLEDLYRLLARWTHVWIQPPHWLDLWTVSRCRVLRERRRSVGAAQVANSEVPAPAPLSIGHPPHAQGRWCRERHARSAARSARGAGACGRSAAPSCVTADADEEDDRCRVATFL
jgi:CheY-like chemotaxis protein